MMHPQLIGGLELKPIGTVVNDIEPGQDARWEETTSKIVIDPEWAEGLSGLEEFSHIIVLFWLDRPKTHETPLRLHPEAREDMPLVGVFATRAPVRPNPIGLTAVELLAREENVLIVRGLDAYHGTPVLDIKPYLVRGDLKNVTATPEWLKRLWNEHDAEG
jgi:tRNA-Thr(GGU) m(6)t(6)A37 methyltransferase TsaA